MMEPVPVQEPALEPVWDSVLALEPVPELVQALGLELAPVPEPAC